MGKVRAAEERLDQERDDLKDQIRAMERQRADLEAKLAHSLRQETDLRDALEKVRCAKASRNKILEEGTICITLFFIYLFIFLSLLLSALALFCSFFHFYLSAY